MKGKIPRTAEAIYIETGRLPKPSRTSSLPRASPVDSLQMARQPRNRCRTTKAAIVRKSGYPDERKCTGCCWKRLRLTPNNCGRNGHERNDCWDLHPEKRPSRRHGTAVAKLATGSRAAITHIMSDLFAHCPLTQTSEVACAQIPVRLLLVWRMTSSRHSSRRGCLSPYLGEAGCVLHPVGMLVYRPR